MLINLLWGKFRMPKISKRFKELTLELRKEVKDYNKIIEKRKKEVNEKFEKTKELINTEDFFDEVNKRLHKIAVDILKKEGFNFDKDRLSDGTRISIDKEGKLTYRAFNHKSWSYISFIRERVIIFEILPTYFIGFLELVKTELGKIELIEKETEETNVEFHVKLKVEKYDDWRTKFEREEIDGMNLFNKEDVGYGIGYMGTPRFKNILNLKEYTDYLYDDRVYESCLSLIELYEKKLEKFKQRIDAIKKQILGLLDKHKEFFVMHEI